MLGELQVQLEAHFKALAEARRPAAYPVYAIEHGLSPDAIRSASSAAGSDHVTLGLRPHHWLVWVVLAAEAGYGYDGEEYWPSLENRPAEWRAQYDRQVLRGWFERFQREFGGPVPQGRWAQHFSIIAWPIAGALLPKYLQGHFARHLYAVRYGLSRLVDASAGEIGAFLAEKSDKRSARYEDFLEQVDLTGRIVLALRDEDLKESVPRVLPGTLARIVSDLERRREAGEFLRAARQVLRSARGVASASLSGSRNSPSDPARSTELVHAPRLVARRGEDGRTLLGVQMPDFALAMRKAGIAPKSFERMRTRLFGEAEKWSPGAALLSWSNMDRPLVAFPAPNAPIIEVEAAPANIAPILSPLIVLGERSVWLLRQGEDNAFREVVKGRVRPSQAYLIVTREAVTQDVIHSLSLRPSVAGLDGISAYAFDTPALIPEAYRLALKGLGLGFSLRAFVEPAGLSPVSAPNFDGPSWAAGEEVILRLSADFPTAGFFVTLDGDRCIRIAAADGPIFVALGALPVGRHTLSVSATTRARASAEPGVDTSAAVFDFCVFEPRPWIDVAAERAGFRVLLDPPDASLERVLTGHAAVNIYGPLGGKVSWRVETIDASGHVAGGGALMQVRLPAGRDGFGAALKRLRDYSDAIDASHRVDLVAELDELGRQTLRFPHAVEPLRWNLNSEKRLWRLIDETAHDEEIRATQMDLARPAVRRRASHTDLVNGIELAPPGALFSVTYKGHRYVALASVLSSDRLTAFSDLGLTQDFRPKGSESAEAIVQLIGAIKLWWRARPIGRLAVVRKSQTVVGLENELRRFACGADWSALLDGSNGRPPELERAQAAVGGSPGFGSRMRTTPWGELSWRERQATFWSYARHYGITEDRDLTDQAVTLAFRPWAFRVPAGENAVEILTKLLPARPLIRGAFLARTATSQNGEALAA